MALAALVSVLAIAALTTTAPALAKSRSCARQIVNDWYGNGRVDKIYPLHCYREAIKSLGPDIVTYSNAKEAIQRALAAAALGKPDPGGPSGLTTLDSGLTLPRGLKPVGIRNTSEKITEFAVPPTALIPPTPPTRTAGPSSVPIPLLVLAGLAILLLAAGGVGYVARRIQSRRGGPPPAGA